MRTFLRLGTALVFASTMACSTRPEAPAAAPDDEAIPESPTSQGKLLRRYSRTHGDYREVIPESLSTKLKGKKLQQQDQPLAIGAEAPRFAGLPAKRPVAIVFYRGYW